jgi:hypothetical protein
MFAILVLVVVVPLVNLQSIMADGLPRGLQTGMAHFTFTVGMTASVLMVLLWYFAWTGCRRAGLALGILYLVAAATGVLVPLTSVVSGNELRGGWSFSLLLVGVYGVGGWALMAAESVDRFQAFQRAVRASSRQRG